MKFRQHLHVGWSTGMQETNYQSDYRASCWWLLHHRWSDRTPSWAWRVHQILTNSRSPPSRMQQEHRESHPTSPLEQILRLFEDEWVWTNWGVVWVYIGSGDVVSWCRLGFSGKPALPRKLVIVQSWDHVGHFFQGRIKNRGAVGDWLKLSFWCALANSWFWLSLNMSTFKFIELHLCFRIVFHFFTLW